MCERVICMWRELLVSTAMRIRDGLEDGQIEKVELALEDADSTGVTQEILRRGIRC